MTPLRTPGEIPLDPAELPRDLGECDACGEVVLLAPGSGLCPACEGLSRAAAEAGRAGAACRTLCETSGRRLSDPGLVLERGEQDRPGGHVRCLRCGRELALVQGPWVRAVAPAHIGGER